MHQSDNYGFSYCGNCDKNKKNISTFINGQGVRNIMNSRNSEVSAVLAFFAGAVVAAGVTLLLTPRAGREVREKIGDVKEEAVQKLKECAREAKFKVSPKTKEDAFFYEGGDCWI
jgi:hypothetical protein